MKLRSPAGLAAGLTAATLLAAPAAAAPVTVQLRIEGPTRTLFEGPVTTDVRPFRFTGDPVVHQCDGTTVGGTSPTPVPTRGAAITAASESGRVAIAGTWDPGLGASFTRIAGEPVAFDPATNRFLGEYKNGVFAQFGACGDPIANGDDVLFAYGTGIETLLALSGPARARPGAPITVRVTASPSGTPVAGAAVAGAVTGADGRAAVGPATTRGPVDLKASKAGAVRSNRLRVCVTDGADGACGTTVPRPSAPDTTGPVARILGIRDGRRFSRRRAPRDLHGTVSADPSGLWAVKLRLTRRRGGRCWYFSGTRERFVRRTCRKPYAFKVGDQPRWSYLLPSRLRRGRYVLEAYAIDKAFNRGALDRVRFRVR
jgi:hypothetical protein